MQCTVFRGYKKRISIIKNIWELSYNDENFLGNLTTVKSHNYESRNIDMSQKYNSIIDDAIMKVSIEKSHYNDKFHYSITMVFVLTDPNWNYKISLYLK